MNTQRSARKPTAQDDAVPSAPQTTPKDNWGYERDAGHVWSEIGRLSQAIGEVKADVSNLKTLYTNLHQDIKDVTEKLEQLNVKTSESLSFVRGAVWVIGGGIAVFGVIMAVVWTSIIQPGIAHAIVEQIKPEIAKQVSEGIARQAPLPGPVRRP